MVITADVFQHLLPTVVGTFTYIMEEMIARAVRIVWRMGERGVDGGGVMEHF